jgi:putative nucleotidyltransferase with HDIG domain
MNPAIRFLISLGQTLATMSLYQPGHPARANARARTLQALDATLKAGAPLRVSFLDQDVIIGHAASPELAGWDWGSKLLQAGVQRLEIDTRPTDAAFDRLLDALLARLSAPAGREPPPFALPGIRLGGLTVIDGHVEAVPTVELVDAVATEMLNAETDAVRWIHEQVARRNTVPMAEVEAVIHGLAVAMQRDQHVVLPLLALKSVDQYTTTHSCNVAMLSMGLAEEVGLGSDDVRAIGTAALLHDIGKVRVSLDVLVKPGKLTDAEYAEMQRHTVEGARILGARGRGHALAAIVAYEHHVWQNGQGGYPHFAFPRTCHYASRLVHICDLYDALSTDRPYRAAWPRERTLAMLQKQAGIEVDSELVQAFLRLVERAEQERTPLVDQPQNDWTAAVARAAAAYGTSDHAALVPNAA